MLELIQPGTNVDFVGNRRYAFIFSGVLTALSLLALAVIGPRYGIDFAGGTLLHLRFQQPLETGAIRGALGDLGGDASVQDFGNTKGEYLLRIPQSATDLAGLGQRIRERLDGAFGSGSYEVLRSE